VEIEEVGHHSPPQPVGHVAQRPADDEPQREPLPPVLGLTHPGEKQDDDKDRDRYESPGRRWMVGRQEAKSNASVVAEAEVKERGDVDLLT
jgi:hypothetical protein